MKEYISATTADLDSVYEIVQNSIKSTYPKYYPNEVVDFFCCLHSKENILRDIEDNLVGILVINGKCVGIVPSTNYCHNHQPALDQIHKRRKKQMSLLYESRLYYQKKYEI